MSAGRLFAGVAAAAALATAATGAALAVRSLTSPWPSVRVIRAVFDKGARETIAEMEPHVPAATFREHRDVVYGASRRNTSYDVVLPAGAGDGPLPVVFWVHGGAWISGDKRDVLPYLRILAADGCAAVGVNYTVSPEAVYPTAITQLAAALAHLAAHAAEFGIDPDRIVIAGDSAGAQLASQLTALVVDAAYAETLGVEPPVSPEQLAGLILHCGVYDLAAMGGLTGVLAWGFRTALWAYTGSKDWSGTPAGATMSTIHRVSSRFPPTLISGGNGDGLTAGQSHPMAERMREAGVDVTPVFWPDDHEPALPHEYQFHLDLAEAREMLGLSRAFLGRVTAREPAPGASTPGASAPRTPAPAQPAATE
ncbi:alpha/beta hydrolase [Herbiconiux sp. 11R-BC]|uniref:alpha/beta hydrolase n=1 Tax=Herbiconiux sp. 11R-BC TaxID=3111637 RepID=UPI003BFB5759